MAADERGAVALYELRPRRPDLVLESFVAFRTDLVPDDVGETYARRHSRPWISAKSRGRVEVVGVDIKQLWDLDARNLSRDRVFDGKVLRLTIQPFVKEAERLAEFQGLTVLGLKKVQVLYAA